MFGSFVSATDSRRDVTIYNKLITDFTPNTAKYVFKGFAEFATNAPAIITGDNYDQRDPATGSLFGGARVNIVNVSKINSEVRGGRSPRIKRLSEYNAADHRHPAHSGRA